MKRSTITEELMDVLTKDDVSKSGRDILADVSENTGTGRWRIWYHEGRHSDGPLSAPAALSEKDRYFIGSLNQRTKYISNLGFFVVPVHTDNIIDTDDDEEMMSANEGRPFKIRSVAMSFDYPETRKDDIDFMLNVVAEACRTLLLFLKNVTEDFSVRSYEFTFNPDENVYRDNRDYIEKKYIKMLCGYGYVNFSDDVFVLEITNCLKSLGVSVNRTAVARAVDVNKGLNKYYYIFTKSGLKPSVAKRLKVMCCLNDNSLEIEIPENENVCLDEIYIGQTSRDMGFKTPVLIVRGTLTVKSLSGLNNLKFISRRHRNNTIVLKNSVSEQMLRYLISNFWFEKLDLREAVIPSGKKIIIDIWDSFNMNIVILKNASDIEIKGSED